MNDIDIVVPWVDNSDPEWRTEFEKYAQEDDLKFDASQCRYRDNGLLRYWFRGMEKCCPWARKIFFVTADESQKPAWLNLDAPRLVWVKHRDYLPRECLPVFSSHPIEMNLHRIPGLGERFVYFNDDIFVVNPVGADFFFSPEDALPRDFAALSSYAFDNFCHFLINDMIAINAHFSFYDCVKNNFFKWMRSSTGMRNTARVLLNFMRRHQCFYSGFVISHHPQPYLKATLEDTWNHCEETLRRTSASRFRSPSDVNQYLFRFWQLAKGDFSPFTTSRRCYVGVAAHADAKRAVAAISGKRFITVCLNDQGAPDEVWSPIAECFSRKFSAPSVFEKNGPV